MSTQDSTAQEISESEETDTPPAKPKLPGWFEVLSNPTLAVISMTCTTIATVSFGLEQLACFLLETKAMGFGVGLPFPFVSIPLGVGGLITTLMLLRTKPRVAILPAIFCLVYLGLVIAFWP